MKILKILILLTLGCTKHVSRLSNVYKNIDEELILASLDGDVSKVKTLLKRRANVNYKDKNGKTALMVASEKGYENIIKALIERGANISEKQSNGFTALMIASYMGHIEVVKLFIENGGDINDKDKNGWSSLLLAAQNEHVEVVKYLIEKGANINDKNIDGVNSLMIASISGCLEMIRLLLEKGSNVNNINNRGNTALMIASQNGHIEVVKLLLEKEVNINNKNIDRITALMLASQNGHIEVVKFLIEKGANINDKTNDNNTALIIALQNRRIEVVKFLLDKGSNVNYKNIYGNTPLIISSMKGHIEIVKLLLERGANVNDKNIYGNIALKEALNRDYTEIVKVLIENYADFSPINNILEEVLIDNIKKNSADKVLSLVHKYRSKIDFNYKDKEGNTFLHYASLINSFNLCNIFLSKNINKNSLNNKGETPLYYALCKDKFDQGFIWYLLNEGFILKPLSLFINDKALDDFLPSDLLDKLILDTLIFKLISSAGVKYRKNRSKIREIVTTLKLKEEDFESEKTLTSFISNTIRSTKNLKVAAALNLEEDLRDVDLDIDAFITILNNFSADNYWEEIKFNLEHNINMFIDILVKIKSTKPISNFSTDNSNYRMFKAKKQLHKLLSLVSQSGKDDKIVFAMNQILVELVLKDGSLEVIDLVLGLFPERDEDSLKNDLSIILLNLRKEILKKAAIGNYRNKYDIHNAAVLDIENPNLLIHLYNSFSDKLQIPFQAPNEYEYNFIYNEDEILKNFNILYNASKLISSVKSQIDPTNNKVLWNKVKYYIEMNIFKGRDVFKIEDFIYDNNFRFKEDAIKALLIHFNFLTY